MDVEQDPSSSSGGVPPALSFSPEEPVHICPRQSATRIPLPHSHAPAATMLPDLIDRLMQADLLSRQEAAAYLALAECQGRLAASAALLEEWASREESSVTKGATEHPVFTPDRSRFPTIGTSTFRPWVWLLLLGEEQTEVRDFIYQGFRHGFEITSTDVAFDSADYCNVGLDSEAERMAVEKTVQVESAAGCIGKRPEWMSPFICSPVFPVPKKSEGEPTGKFRLAQHLSKGSNSQPSVNDYVSDADSKFQLSSIDTAIEAILDIQEEAASEGLGRPSGGGSSVPDIRMTVIDAERAFRLLPLNPKCYPMTGWRDLQGQEWFEGFLMFGLRCAPRMYSALSMTIAWLLRAFGIRATIVYIDDFLLVSVGEEESKLAARVAVAVFRLLGVPIQWGKEQTPNSPKAKYLGFMLDAHQNTISLTDGRWVRLKEKVREWMTRTRASGKEIAQLCGHLCHAAKVVRAGRLFLPRLFARIYYAEQRARKTKFPTLVELGKEFQKDLHWWFCMMEYHRQARMTRALRPWDVMVFTDACTGFGCAGYWPEEGKFWQVLWEGDTAYMAKFRGNSINVQEMFALPITAMIGGPDWRGKVILFRCDNQGDVYSVKKRKSRNGHIMHLMRVLHYLAALFEFVVRIEYVNTRDNPADAPSRQRAAALLGDPVLGKQYRTQVPVNWLPPRLDDPTWEASLSAVVLDRLRARGAERSPGLLDSEL